MQPEQPGTPMPDPNTELPSGPHATTLAGWAFQGRIITIGLVTGCVVMGSIFWMISDQPAPPAEADPQGDDTTEIIFVAIGAVALVINCVMAFLVPHIIRSAGALRLKTAENAAASVRLWSDWPERETLPLPLIRFCQTDQTARLIGQALLEGTAIINFVMMFLTQSAVNLLCALVALVGVLAMFPTINGMRVRIESALKE
ncbi:hypothetical protein LOC71_10040 [Rhodopirellula sp. JC740]|uniref:ABC transmembrane type-1 domain-containing protein n=1 Tax=Rhodopirellula halodulae TaxID=2894198 RepID=A0ABS8NGF3_9BACT|nr:hypothetical protein [Rhodopirellula sp. JC740]MCC9642615.1 hypothetical protein [Rhodopirellula sp. JC740]